MIRKLYKYLNADMVEMIVNDMKNEEELLTLFNVFEKVQYRSQNERWMTTELVGNLNNRAVEKILGGIMKSGQNALFLIELSNDIDRLDSQLARDMADKVWRVCSINE
ncbi:hypothetical protein OCOL_000719 [Ordospora colligata]